MRARRLCVGFVFTLVAVAIMSVPAQAQMSLTELTASAHGARIQFIAPSAPVFPGGEVLALSPSSASAMVTGFGGSSAFAAAPYTGETITSLPETANGASGEEVPSLPSVPGYVASSYPARPNPPEQQYGSSYTIAANSDERSSQARAAAGLLTDDEPASTLASKAKATVTLDENGEEGMAVAVANFSPFRIPGEVSIGEVRAEASVTAAADGSLKKTHSLDVGTISVAGKKFGFTEDGFVLDGEPKDGIMPDDQAELDAILELTGVTIEIAPATETQDSVTSAGLVVTFPIDVPSQGPTTTRLILGQATASAFGRPPVTPPTSDADFSSPSDVPSDVESPGDGVASPDQASGLTDEQQQPVSVAPSGSETSAPAPVIAPPEEKEQPSAAMAVGVDAGPDGLGLYLLSVASGLLLVGLSRAMSRYAITLQGAGGAAALSLSEGALPESLQQRLRRIQRRA